MKKYKSYAVVDIDGKKMIDYFLATYFYAKSDEEAERKAKAHYKERDFSLGDGKYTK